MPETENNVVDAEGEVVEGGEAQIVETITVTAEEWTQAADYAKNLWLAMDKKGKHTNSAPDIVRALDEKYGWCPDPSTIYRWAMKRWVPGEMTWRELWDTAKNRGLTQDVITGQERGLVQLDGKGETGTDNEGTIINLLTQDIRAMMVTNSQRRELYGKVELWILNRFVRRMEEADAEVERIAAKKAAGETLLPLEEENELNGGFSMEDALALMPISSVKSGFESACKIFSEQELLEHIKHLASTTADDEGGMLEVLEQSGSEIATEVIVQTAKLLHEVDKAKGRR